MNTVIKYSTLLLLLAVMVLTGCRKFADVGDAELSDYDAEFAIPLLSAKTTMQEILEESGDIDSMIIDSENCIRLFYEGDLTARSSSDIFEIVQFAPFEVAETCTAFEFALPASIDLDFVNLNGGQLTYTFSSEHEEDVDVIIRIPQLVNIASGNEFKKEIPLAYNGMPPSQFGAWDVDGFRLNSQEDSIFIYYDVIRQDGSSDTLVNLYMAALNFTFSYAEGYLGTDLYELERDTIQIDFFDKWVQGNIYFADPKIYMDVHNSFGIPVRSSVNVMDIYTVSGEVLPLESQFLVDGINIDYPSLDEVGETKITPFEFNVSNSNIDVVLGAGPIAVDYDIDGIPNPDLDTTIRGFMTDSSLFSVQVLVELPIYGSASNFVGFDTFDINIEEYNNVEYAEFKIITENEMALGVDLQLYFADNNFQIIDSLLVEGQQLMEAAPADENGNAISVAEKITYIKFDRARFENIKEARKLLLDASFSTWQDGDVSVKIKADEGIAVRMGMKLGITQ